MVFLRWGMVFACVLGLAVLACVAGAETAAQDVRDGYYSVVEFGARGDGVTDDTAAFQKAADKASARGGYVTVPPVGLGKGYVITRTVRLPSGVSLLGSPAGFGNDAYAAFDLPEQRVHGAKIFARPQASDYDGPKKKPLFLLEGGNTLRGFWIMYDQQPWPTDQEFADARSPYHYASFGEARSSFVKDHVKPYGPTLYLPKTAVNVVIEDVVCDRYYDFYFQAGGGKNLVDRVYLYGYNRGFVIAESYDVNRIANIHLCPNAGPATPGEVGPGKHYSWIYGIVVSRPENVGIQLGKSDGYCFRDLFFYGVHTGIRFGASAAYPLRDPVEGVDCYYDPATNKLSGFSALSASYKAGGPWGSISSASVDGCAIGFHFVWPTTMTTCMLTNAYIATSFDDGRRFATKLDKPVAYQGAFVVEPTYCRANNIGIIPTFKCSNVQVSSFGAVSDRFASAAAGCNGRVFLVGGDVAMDFSNLQINAPYGVENLYAAGEQAKRFSIHIRGFNQTGEPTPDMDITESGPVGHGGNP